MHGVIMDSPAFASISRPRFSMLLFVLQDAVYINRAAAIRRKHCAFAPLRPDIYPLGVLYPKDNRGIFARA